MTTAILVAILLGLLIVTSAGLWRVATVYAAHLQRENAAKTQRVAELESMIDHVRADRLNVPAPATRREILADSTELDPVLQGNLDMIEDVEARAEYEALIRGRLLDDPSLDPVRLAADIFGR